MREGIPVRRKYPVPTAIHSLASHHSRNFARPKSLHAILWRHASQNALVIVSKDADFSSRMMNSTPPPWIVHLRFGNLKRAEFESLLATAWPRIESLLPQHKLIHVFTDRIEAIKDSKSNPK